MSRLATKRRRRLRNKPIRLLTSAGDPGQRIPCTRNAAESGSLSDRPLAQLPGVANSLHVLTFGPSQAGRRRTLSQPLIPAEDCQTTNARTK